MGGSGGRTTATFTTALVTRRSNKCVTVNGGAEHGAPVVQWYCPYSTADHPCVADGHGQPAAAVRLRTGRPVR
jgi:hypothetical protein